MNKKELLPIQLVPLGDKAIVLQFEDVLSHGTHAKIQAMAQYLEQHPVPGILEHVPAYTTLTVYYDPWLLSQNGTRDPYDAAVAYLQTALSEAKGRVRHTETAVEIPVCYGGAYGPDLEEVARHNRLSPQEVVALHTQNEYLVHMMGFAPGFPYLGGMNKQLATPRKQEPRASIPVGSVGIAGEQTGVYSIATPGGWQLIGRTPLILFDASRPQPSLLKTGDRVRFVAITEDEFKKQAKQYEH